MLHFTKEAIREAVHKKEKEQRFEIKADLKDNRPVLCFGHPAVAKVLLIEEFHYVVVFENSITSVKRHLVVLCDNSA